MAPALRLADPNFWAMFFCKVALTCRLLCRTTPELSQKEAQSSASHIDATAAASSKWYSELTCVANN